MADDVPETTAADVIALAIARGRTSPPERATASQSDRALAKQIIAALGQQGWEITSGR